MLNNENILKLKKIISILEKDQNNIDECSIVAETGYDESILIGTSKGFIDLALFLLKLGLSDFKQNTNFDFEKDQVNEVNCYSSGDLKKYFNEFADVLPVSAYLVKNENELKKIIEALKGRG